MARSSWNLHDPDIVGLEFMGVGYTTHAVHSHENWRAVRFRAQRTGEVDEVAVYSGRNTVNPVLGPVYFRGKRAPFIIELIPASGFDPGGIHTIDTYPSSISSASGVSNQAGATSGFSDELSAANDGKFLISAAGVPASATVRMPGTGIYPSGRHVLSVAIEHNFLRQMQVSRLDGNTLTGWSRVLPANLNKWHMGEAFLDSSDPGTWRLWTPADIRMFDSPPVNRRLKVNSLSRTQSQLMDLLRLHVDSIPERRAGVGIFESDLKDGWVTIALHAPTATGAPAHVTEGAEYVLLVRTPAGFTDYNTAAVLDSRATGIRRLGSSFQHFVDLDWDYRNVEVWDEFTPRRLTAVVDGLPAFRLLNDGAQTVDSQPYDRSIGARVFSGQTAAQRALGTDPTTEYASLRFVVSDVFTPIDVLQVTVTGAGGGTGPHNVTADAVAAGPIVGVDELGHTYREVQLEFGSGVLLPDPVDIVFSSDTVPSNPWLIAALASRTPPGSGDQTFVGSFGGSFAEGLALDPVSTLVTGIDAYGRADLEAVLLSQAPEVTGVDLVVQQQPVTGGVCEPCGPDDPLGCEVLSIPHAQLCWSSSTLPLAEFSHYEVQRAEDGGEWVTVEAITVTGAPVEPERGTALYSLSAGTSHVAPSVDAFANSILFSAWQSFDFRSNYTVPGSMTAGPETDGASFSTMRSAQQAIAAAGSTGTRTATFGVSDRWSSVSAVLRGDGAVPTLQQTLSGVSANAVSLVTSVGTQRGWWMVAIQGWDESDAATMPPPSGLGWTLLADSAWCCQPTGASTSTSRTAIWAKRVTVNGAQSVTFYDGLGVADNHAHLFVLSGVDTVTAADNVPNCWDDWSAPYDRRMCYRIRQTRQDGVSSDWSPPVCTVVDFPAGSDIVITAPYDPDLNVAFPEAHGGRLPVEREWTLQDANEVTYRQVYGRDYQLAFRPLERKGVTFARNLMISALCTPTTPCIDVVERLRELTTAATPYLVVRDYCGNRWYASVVVPTVTQHRVPGLKGDRDTLWFVDIRVTELVTPVVEVPMTDE